jgi:hypothetical protein
MTRRRYTPSEKAKAVGLAVVHGVTETERRTGIAHQRISHWLDVVDPSGEMRHKSRDKVAEEMWAVIQVGVDEIAKGIKGDAPLRDKVVAVGVLYDKFALLTGSATARTESRDLSGTFSDSELIDAVREAQRLATAGRAAAAPAGTTEGEGV